MKIVSLVLIAAYLLLPAICLGHVFHIVPTECHLVDTIFNEAEGVPYGDNSEGETEERICSCEEHLPNPIFIDFTSAYLEFKLFPFEPELYLSGFLNRIFIPPEFSS